MHPTRFDLVRPCPGCPFTCTVAGYLRPERAAEIADAILMHNDSFTCHKTTESQTDAEGFDTNVSTDASQWCAGALIFYYKLESQDIDYANSMIQISERLGWLQFDRFDHSSFPRVFNSRNAMVVHHAEARKAFMLLSDKQRVIINGLGMRGLAARLECDGLTGIIHTYLAGEQIPHQVFSGSIQLDEANFVPLHFWIDLDTGERIDFAARMWLGDLPVVPHGVFVPADFQQTIYTGTRVAMSLFSPSLIEHLLTPFPMHLLEDNHG